MDFEHEVNRLGTSCEKWDSMPQLFGREDLIPMWVADTEFPAPDAVLDALRRRMEHPVFGYVQRPREVVGAFRFWLQRRHGFDVPEECVRVCDSVMNGLAMAVNALTCPGESIALQTPVYDPFYRVIENNGRVIAPNPLLHENGAWRMDFDGLEKIFAGGCRAMLFCNPQNPTGRVWTKDELETLAGLLRRYDVTVFSDDIHSDLVSPGHVYTPLASLDGMRPRVLTSYSTSKTFNIAGIKGSYILIEDGEKREKFAAWQARTHTGEPNVFSYAAMAAAYRCGDEYCDELCRTVYANMAYVQSFIDGHLPKIRTQVSEGTYLMLWDCGGMGLRGPELRDWFVERAGVAFSAGATYGEAIADHVRVNVACPLSMVKRAMNQVRQAFEA